MRLYPVLEPLVGCIIQVIWRPTVSGNDNIPKTGPVIMACNHQAAAETYFVPCMISREVHWLAKDALFKGKGLPGKAFAWLMRSVNVIPVDRSDTGKASQALKAGLEVLNAGNLLGVFPEGTRSPDGRLYKGKTGAVRLALASGAPIVPVAVLGAFESSGSSVLPRLNPRIHAEIGTPINMPGELVRMREKSGVEQGAPVSRDELHALTRILMDAIRDMSGQDYVDEYAAHVKKRMKQAP